MKSSSLNANSGAKSNASLNINVNAEANGSANASNNANPNPNPVNEENPGNRQRLIIDLMRNIRRNISPISEHFAVYISDRGLCSFGKIISILDFSFL